MDLEIFLKILFNKERDNYPGIRENVVQYLSISDADSLYHAFRFIPSIAERYHSVGYSYIDSGIILSLGLIGCEIYPIQRIFHDMSVLVRAINTMVVNWMSRCNIVHSIFIGKKVNAFLIMSSDNIEFYTILSINVVKDSISNPHTVDIHLKRTRKFDNTSIHSNKTSFYYHSEKISDYINQFCSLISLTVAQERNEFKTILGES